MLFEKYNVTLPLLKWHLNLSVRFYWFTWLLEIKIDHLSLIISMTMTMTIVFDRPYGEAYLSANAIAKMWVRPSVRPSHLDTDDLWPDAYTDWVNLWQVPIPGEEQPPRPMGTLLPRGELWAPNVLVLWEDIGHIWATAMKFGTHKHTTWQR